MSEVTPPATFQPARFAGGPLDGKTVMLPDGSQSALAADRGSSRGWVYQRGADGVLTLVTDHDDSLVYPDGPQTGERRLDWERLDGVERLPVVNVTAVEENFADEPVSDGWDETPTPPATQ